MIGKLERYPSTQRSGAVLGVVTKVYIIIQTVNAFRCFVWFRASYHDGAARLAPGNFNVCTLRNFNTRRVNMSYQQVSSLANQAIVPSVFQQERHQNQQDFHHSSLKTWKAKLLKKEVNSYLNVESQEIHRQQLNGITMISKNDLYQILWYNQFRFNKPRGCVFLNLFINIILYLFHERSESSYYLEFHFLCSL